jgi:hypothetical protein
VQAASFHYTRSPDNSAPDTDSASSDLGDIAPSAAPLTRKWLCEAGDGPPLP